jgi:hypothetical protein
VAWLFAGFRSPLALTKTTSCILWPAGIREVHVAWKAPRPGMLKITGAEDAVWPLSAMSLKVTEALCVPAVPRFRTIAVKVVGWPGIGTAGLRAISGTLTLRSRPVTALVGGTPLPWEAENEPSAPPGPGRTGAPLLGAAKAVTAPFGPGLLGAPLDDATGAPVEPGRGGRGVMDLMGGVFPAEGGWAGAICLVATGFEGAGADADVEPLLPLVAGSTPLGRGAGLLGKTMRPI